jgi:folate-binding protein YgfZ
VRQQLQRYVLRAKVTIEAAGTAWSIYGLHGPDAEAAASTRVHMPADGDGLRHIIVAPRGEYMPEAEYTDRDEWRLDDIAAGIPEIGSPVSGLWVAQMLNLDLIGAVSFNKGCYTGQEVIARAHFRGQVKRRMQRFSTEGNALLAPGTRVTLADAAPLLYLVAPLFRFNETTRLIAGSISDRVPVYRIGINEDWRAGVRVLFSERLNSSSKKEKGI